MTALGKRVLILSDNDGLSRAIEVNLSGQPELEIVKLGMEPLKRPGDRIREDEFDLIVVAMSSPASEPVVALSRACLADRIGQVPLLIVSDRPFDSEPDDQIAHLDFPFEIDGLYKKVQEILQAEKIRPAAN